MDYSPPEHWPVAVAHDVLLAYTDDTHAPVGLRVSPSELELTLRVVLRTPFEADWAPRNRFLFGHFGSPGPHLEWWVHYATEPGGPGLGFSPSSHAPAVFLERASIRPMPTADLLVSFDWEARGIQTRTLVEVAPLQELAQQATDLWPAHHPTATRTQVSEPRTHG